MDSECDICYVERKRKVSLMKIMGNIVCPVCELDKDHKKLEKQINDEYRENKRKVLYNRSMIADNTILAATFDTFIPETEEDHKNLALAKEMADDLKDDILFNLIMVGKTGAGKSHLSYSICREVNETSEKPKEVLFISLGLLFTKIKASFDDDTLPTEAFFVELLKRVDVLVLDDLGMELGNIDDEKVKATPFVSRVLNAVLDGRQDKRTIITTNLTGERLTKIYDDRTISRMFRNYRFIKFENTRDKRKVQLPF